jgi:hypothetical protein
MEPLLAHENPPQGVYYTEDSRNERPREDKIQEAETNPPDVELMNAHASYKKSQSNGNAVIFHNIIVKYNVIKH